MVECSALQHVDHIKELREFDATNGGEKTDSRLKAGFST